MDTGVCAPTSNILVSNNGWGNMDTVSANA